jgi:Flp pilus assembly pilin Flp
MSDFYTQLEETYREFCIQARGATVGLRRRLSEERGQTAAEYMGILLFVAVVIGAMIFADVDGAIADAAKTMVGKIAGGNEHR